MFLEYVLPADNMKGKESPLMREDKKWTESGSKASALRLPVPQISHLWNKGCGLSWVVSMNLAYEQTDKER